MDKTCGRCRWFRDARGDTVDPKTLKETIEVYCWALPPSPMSVVEGITGSGEECAGLLRKPGRLFNLDLHVDEHAAQALPVVWTGRAGCALWGLPAAEGGAEGE